jgi:hypothetical protein
MNYDELSAAARANPTAADFHTLRMAYARSDAYAPYVRERAIRISVEAMSQALRAGDLDGALQAAEDLLASSYLDIEAHMVADYVHTLRGSTTQAAYHRAFAQGLIGALLASGDGRSPRTAFIVLTPSEEHTVLRALGYTMTRQAVVQEDGHRYDMLQARHSRTGEAAEFYFNIDLPFGWLQRQKRASGAHDHDEDGGTR